jgi:hypothetical protein
LHVKHVGVFGYVFALLEFGGFLVGGFCVYGMLAEREMCPSCNLYLRKVMSSSKELADTDAVVSYTAPLKELLPDPKMSMIGRESLALASPEPVPVKVSFELLGCPICQSQVLKQSIAVRDGKEWKSVNSLTRAFQIPAGVDVRARIS